MVANIISYSSNLGISLVLTPFFINTLGKDVYSFYPIANNIVSYLSILTNSLNTMASRFVTVSLVQGDEKEANRYFSSVLASNGIISAILLIPMIVIVVYIDRFLNVPINSVAAVRTLFSFVFAAMIVNVAGSVYGIATFAKNRIDLRSFREIVTSVIRLVLYIILYKILPPSIIYIGIVALIVAGINLAFQFVYTKILLPDIRLNRRYVSRSHTFRLLSSSVWNMIFVFGNTLLAGMTLILANIFFGANASGLISIVQTVPACFNGIISMLVGVFFPVITYKTAENDIRGTVDQLLKAERMIAIMSCSVITVFSALANEFFSLWVPGENSGYLSVLSLITIVPHLIISCTWILTDLNVALNKVRTPAVFTLVMGGMNVVSAVTAVRVFDAPLAALPVISTILQIIWAGIFLPYYASIELGISRRTFFLPLIKATGASIICFICIMLLKRLFILDSWFKIICFGGAAGMVTLFIFSMFEIGPKHIKEITEKLKMKSGGE